ncbi:UbiD family decarboxylase domain-containing protein, partial [Thermodesulfobacteriota bacterium]
PKQTGTLVTYRQDIGKNYLSHKIKGKNMPIAVAIGVDPLMHISSQINAPRDLAEYAFAGALAGENVQMVKCKNSDLIVPKSAEIILEGEIMLDELHSEGPFGEFPGFYSGRRDLHVFKVHRLLMKEDAIYPGMGVGKDPNEGNLLTSLGSNLSFMKYASTHFSEINGIRSITGNGFTTVVSIDHNKAYPGIGKAAGHFVWSSPQVAKEAKNIIVVDDTIDIYSDIDIFWAIGNYVQGNRDISWVEGTPGTILDPSEPWGMGHIVDDKTLQTTCTTVIDATPKYGVFAEGYARGVVDVPEEVKKKVEAKWSEWGLDKFV